MVLDIEGDPLYRQPFKHVLPIAYFALPRGDYNMQKTFLDITGYFFSLSLEKSSTDLAKHIWMSLTYSWYCDYLAFLLKKLQ